MERYRYTPLVHVARPITKPRIDRYFCYVPRKRAGMEPGATKGLHTLTMILSSAAVRAYFCSVQNLTIEESYGHLASVVSDTCGTLRHLPSEANFRRCIGRMATDARARHPSLDDRYLP